ncbi:hypothetical protein VF14_08780 [Nostoc linckia z18]|uniref:Uncharacterized protein n=3 Tax=Nostoc linckia TaxID=92942 RepID=A0A9Q6EM55_NOSLI|nr:hypothetical protein [Nostoc linckia]PHJ59562.1 hypothetical protein VF02_24405 [Nostoc linckia z1]PHJ65161.1 hypothetical protein VF05_21745 [Nostoc linckia z3]PHJ69565.1 hypothetical protein VF03_23485 [Nostoc linckia z2]PHJ83611.1 hypothetical protein VF06_12200 [Nostoc linckia z4]PHJ86262.1 hypothetical protein VF07_22130 [Nostoc linckia z6]PHJ96292.1 hypothetical protein VF04_16520 [Nostoc linckia z7]PHK22633.1 hypothetical protein VF11_04595 [Nostoc linckia z14]PHK25356.1 hypotheti
MARVSKRLQMMRVVHFGSAYGFWFALGVSACHFSRLLVGGWIIYFALKLSIAGWLLLIPPEDPTQETLMLRRLSGLAMALSVIAFWDILVTALSNPITLGYWILPTWQVGFLGLGVLVAMLLFLAFLK